MKKKVLLHVGAKGETVQQQREISLLPHYFSLWLLERHTIYFIIIIFFLRTIKI